MGLGLFGKIVEEVVKAPFDAVSGAMKGVSEGVKGLTEPDEEKKP